MTWADYPKLHEEDDEYSSDIVIKKEDDDDDTPKAITSANKSKGKGEHKDKSKDKEPVSAKVEKKLKTLKAYRNRKRQSEQIAPVKVERGAKNTSQAHQSSLSQPHTTGSGFGKHLEHLNDPNYDPYPQVCFYKMSE